MEDRPKVIFWYNLYLWLLAILYVLVAGCGMVLLFLPATALEMKEPEKIVSAVVCFAVGLPFAAASLLPFAFYPKPWLWVYGIVMIAIGLTSCCFWPICIPLLIYWIKPDVQRHFGRNAQTKNPPGEIP